jgi:hypothetical protein
MEEYITRKESLAKQYVLTAADFEQIKAHGITLDKIENELLLFQSGITKIYLERPATIEDLKSALLFSIKKNQISNSKSLFRLLVRLAGCLNF